jgi:hypothetical protein
MYYVVARSGEQVHFGWASFLMDTDLLDEALTATKQIVEEKRPQAAWDHYCAAHVSRHGEPFFCDVTPDWRLSMPRAMLDRYYGRQEAAVRDGPLETLDIDDPLFVHFGYTLSPYGKWVTQRAKKRKLVVEPYEGDLRHVTKES